MTKKKDICSNYFLPTSDRNQRALCNSDRKQTYLDSLSTNLNIFVCIIAAAKSEYYERLLYYDKAHIYFITIYFVIYQLVCGFFPPPECQGRFEQQTGLSDMQGFNGIYLGLYPYGSRPL